MRIERHEIERVAKCSTLQEARKLMQDIVLPRIGNDLARSNMRANISNKPSITTLVALGWDMMLKDQGFGDPAVVNTKKGIGYARR